MELDLARFEPSLSSALVRITGAVYLPFVPKDQVTNTHTQCTYTLHAMRVHFIKTLEKDHDF